MTASPVSLPEDVAGLLERLGRTVDVFVAPDQVTTRGEHDALGGDPVLPGFVLPLLALFAELDQQG